MRKWTVIWPMKSWESSSKILILNIWFESSLFIALIKKIMIYKYMNINVIIPRKFSNFVQWTQFGFFRPET